MIWVRDFYIKFSNLIKFWYEGVSSNFRKPKVSSAMEFLFLRFVTRLELLNFFLAREKIVFWILSKIQFSQKWCGHLNSFSNNNLTNESLALKTFKTFADRFKMASLTLLIKKNDTEDTTKTNQCLLLLRWQNFEGVLKFMKGFLKVKSSDHFHFVNTSIIYAKLSILIS